LHSTIQTLTDEKTKLEASIPENWLSSESEYKALEKALNKARKDYYNAVDSSYEAFREIHLIIADSPKLNEYSDSLSKLDQVVLNISNVHDANLAVENIETLEKELGNLKGINSIKSKISKARRAFKKANDEVAINEAKNKALGFIREAQQTYQEEMKWRSNAAKALLPNLQNYNDAISKNIGLRQQQRFTDVQAKQMAACLSHHRNLSLAF